MSAVELTELQAEVFAVLTRMPQGTPDVALASGRDLRTTREALFALKKKGRVVMSHGRPQCWARAPRPRRQTQRLATAPTTPVRLTEAQIGYLLGLACPQCSRPYGDHETSCSRDEDEAVWARRQLQERYAGMSDHPPKAASELLPTLKRVA